MMRSKSALFGIVSDEFVFVFDELHSSEGHCSLWEGIGITALDHLFNRPVDEGCLCKLLSCF